MEEWVRESEREKSWVRSRNPKCCMRAIPHNPVPVLLDAGIHGVDYVLQTYIRTCIQDNYVAFLFRAVI